MTNQYLQQLIVEMQNRDGGFVLNLDDEPAAVVLNIEKYNQLLRGISINNLDQIQNVNNMKNNKVLVTGGAGYIGGHLVRELVLAGYDVTVLDNLCTGKESNIDKKARFVKGDLSDKELLKELFASNKFDAVFHMAASLEVEESVRESAKYFENNVINTSKLLNAMNEAGVKKIIFSSTAAVYGRAGKDPVTEDFPLHPNNPYGYTKLLAERIIKFHAEYLAFQAVVFRYFNACGFEVGANILPTHQSHLIYNVLQVVKGEKEQLNVFGNDYETFDGTCIRDYVHVKDIVLPHILALEKMTHADQTSDQSSRVGTPESIGQKNKNFEVFNIGTGKGSSVWEVTTQTSEILNRIIPMQVSSRRKGDAPVTVANNTKLTNKLGYHLQFSSLENIICSSWEVMKNL